MKAPLLSVEQLGVDYHTEAGWTSALEGVDLRVEAGEIVGVVGESGCGKSTLASAIMGLLGDNARISHGRVLLEGEDLRGRDEARMRELWGDRLSMIFQDPGTSLNPVLTIEQQLMTPLRARAKRTGAPAGALRERMLRMLERVGIPSPAERARGYPHEFSGGMRQRVMIAMALLSNPALLVADEPTSALDVTLAAQINDLLLGLRDELGTAILYITHDLGVVAQICDKVVVMYAGRVVETGTVFDLFARPQHPYTQALLRASPSAHHAATRLATIPGRVPSLSEMPPGCRFADRCPHARAICRAAAPPHYEVGAQEVACHMHGPAWQGTGVGKGAAEGQGGQEAHAADPAAAPTHPSDQRARATASVQEPARPDANATGEEALVRIEGLKVHFPERVPLVPRLLGRAGSPLRAVDGVDLSIERGEILALVGESGSGKTTLGRTVLKLLDGTAGKITVAGRELASLSGPELRPLRAGMQMIFQEATASLSPRMRVRDLLLEPFTIHGRRAGDPERKVAELLGMVGLSDEQADKYPHQLSGGQARRVGIARALALEPSLLVADEPTSGLDVSVGAGILNLLRDLRDRLDLTLLLITHDLNIIRYMADRVAVMYLGRVVELGASERLLSAPRHPYTEALLSAVAAPDPNLRHEQRRIVLPGEPPSPRDPPPGCPFHPRCRYAEARCASERPALRPVDGGPHETACHFPERVGAPPNPGTGTEKEID